MIRPEPRCGTASTAPVFADLPGHRRDRCRFTPDGTEIVITGSTTIRCCVRAATASHSVGARLRRPGSRRLQPRRLDRGRSGGRRHGEPVGPSHRHRANRSCPGRPDRSRHGARSGRSSPPSRAQKESSCCGMSRPRRPTNSNASTTAVSFNAREPTFSPTVGSSPSTITPSAVESPSSTSPAVACSAGALGGQIGALVYQPDSGYIAIATGGGCSLGAATGRIRAKRRITGSEGWSSPTEADASRFRAFRSARRSHRARAVGRDHADQVARHGRRRRQRRSSGASPDGTNSSPAPTAATSSSGISPSAGGFSPCRIADTAT